MSTPINIKIDSETYSAYPQRIIIGHRGDVHVRQLVFDADVIAGISQYYVRFLIPDGETVYENALQNVTSSDKKHRFMCDVPAAVTALTGEGYLQWVARTSNGTTIAKSDMVRFTVLESVSDETEPIPTPETTEAAVDKVEKAAEDAIKAAEEAKKAAEEAIEEFAKGTTGDRAAKKTVYLDAENGDDTNDGLTKSAKMKTLAAAISKYSAVPNLELQLTAGEYANIGIENQRVSIVGTGNDTTINAITVKSGTLILDGAQVRMVAVSECGRLYACANSQVTITVGIAATSNSHVYLDGVEFQPPSAGDNVLMSSGGSVISVNNSNINTGQIQAESTGRIYLYGTLYGNYVADDGGIIVADGIQIAPKTGTTQPVTQETVLNRTIYLNAATGSDSNSGLSANNSMQTIAGALSKYPNIPTIIFQIASGNYTGNFNIKNQCVEIHAADDSGGINFTSSITVESGTLILADRVSMESDETAITVKNGGCLIATGSSFSSSTSSAADNLPYVLVSDNSTAFLNGCTFAAFGKTSKILLSAENGSVVRTIRCNYGGSASYGIIQAKTASKIVDDNTIISPTQSNAESGSIIYRNGVQIAPYVPPVVDRVTVYLNASTGSDADSGLSVDKPMGTVAAALKKYSTCANIRLQFAAGTYDIGISAENKKIALAGADTATTILNGRISVTSCTLTMSNLTVSASGYGGGATVSASTGSHVYGYRANISISTSTAQYMEPCLFVSTSSQCYLDGAAITMTAEDESNASSAIAVRSSGGSVVGLGYCKISSTICASTTGEIKTIGSTVGGTKIESGGVIYVNGALTTATA